MTLTSLSPLGENGHLSAGTTVPSLAVPGSGRRGWGAGGSRREPCDVGEGVGEVASLSQEVSCLTVSNLWRPVLKPASLSSQLVTCLGH